MDCIWSGVDVQSVIGDITGIKADVDASLDVISNVEISVGANNGADTAQIKSDVVWIKEWIQGYDIDYKTKYQNIMDKLDIIGGQCQVLENMLLCSAESAVKEIRDKVRLINDWTILVSADIAGIGLDTDDIILKEGQIKDKQIEMGNHFDGEITGIKAQLSALEAYNTVEEPIIYTSRLAGEKLILTTELGAMLTSIGALTEITNLEIGKDGAITRTAIEANTKDVTDKEDKIEAKIDKIQDVMKAQTLETNIYDEIVQKIAIWANLDGLSGIYDGDYKMKNGGIGSQVKVDSDMPQWNYLIKIKDVEGNDQYFTEVTEQALASLHQNLYRR